MHEYTCAVVSVLIHSFLPVLRTVSGTVLILSLFFILSRFMGGKVKKSTLYISNSKKSCGLRCH